MQTVTCPACGLSFETTASTNTRCRRCRKVVNIGPGKSRSPMTTEGDYSFDEDEAPAGSGWALAALVGAAALAFWLFGRGGNQP
jgi:hypothetical protein